MDKRKPNLDEIDSQMVAIKDNLVTIQSQVTKSDQETGAFKVEALKAQQEQKASLDLIEHQVSAIKSELITLRQNIAQNDSEIDVLQIESAKAQKPWHRDVPIIIAILALLFSFGTTAVSYYTSAQQAIQNDRSELRVHLQRLAALSKDNVEILNNADKLIAGQISGYIAAEAMLLASQALEIMERIPNYVSATEYNLVANTLSNTGNFYQARIVFQRAIEVSKDTNEELSSLHQYGTLLYATGDIEEGRDMFQKALDIHQKYPFLVSYYRDLSNASTEMYWSRAELGQQNCSEAQIHLQTAFEHASHLPPGPEADIVLQQLEETKKFIDDCK
jgi:tetratricopeptide (TPR) repeat protein